MSGHVYGHHDHVLVAPVLHTPGTRLVTTASGVVDDCPLTLLLSLRLLSALMTIVLVVCLPQEIGTAVKRE